MFNVMLPWDDPSNGILGRPDPYEILDSGPFVNTAERNFDKVEHHSRNVSPQTGTVKVQASLPDE